jgi:hypothetical protein
MDREEQIFEDLDGNIDEPATEEVELDAEVKEDDDLEVEIADSGEEQEQPEEEEEEAKEEVATKPEASDDEDDLASYSKKVRKRIERERKIARAAKAEAEALRQQLNAIHAEKEVSATQEQLDATLTEKRAKLKAIREEFDPEKVDEELALFEEIADLQAQKRHVSSARGTPPATKPQESKPTNPHVAKWLDRNKEWFDAPEYSAQSAVARQIDQALSAEGYKPSDEEYYQELDRRLAKTVKLPTRTKPKSPVAPVTESATHSKTKVVLTKQDLAFMAKMGMDPKNPAHLKAFAAERRSSSLRDK